MIMGRKRNIEQEIEDVLFSLSAQVSALEAAKERECPDEPTSENASSASISLGSAIPSPISWEECVALARSAHGEGHSVDELLTEEERSAADDTVRRLNDEYNAVHRLDKVDIAISVSAGTISSAMEILLVGIPERTSGGLRAKPLENYVRDWFLETFPPEEMEKLARDVVSKVPYDAPYNKGFTKEYVEGLWPAMHRLYSLGHDPLLGFIVGTLDILRGRMTTVDKFGRILSQEIPRYAGREEASIFAALCKQLVHLKSDVTTSMGLPAPLMGLFNLMQFGSIGDEDQTIAEIVQGMYYEGYDFQHFCAQSIPIMVNEVIVRLGYCLKRIKEGHSVPESIPVTTNREKRPKLGTMLFISHSLATTVNAGQIAFSKNPMEINYPQWVFFAYRSIGQAKWVLSEKPRKKHEYVMQALEAEIVFDALPETNELIVLGGEEPRIIG